MGRLSSSTRRRGIRNFSIATTSALSGSGGSWGASATAASRCARSSSSQRCRIRGSDWSKWEDATIWSHLPSAARTRAWHPVRGRSARRPLLVRGRLSDRQAVRVSTDCSTSAGLSRPTRSRRSHRRFRRDCAFCLQHRHSSRGTAARSGCGTPSPRSRGACWTRSPGHIEATSLLARAESNLAGPSVVRSKRAVSVRQRQKYEQCHGAFARRRRAPVSCAAPPDRGRSRRRALARHQRGDHAGRRARVPRRTRDGARSSDRAALPRRHSLPATRARRGAPAADALRRKPSRRARSSTTTSACARGRRIAPTRRSHRIGARLRSNPITRSRRTTWVSRCGKATTSPRAIAASGARSRSIRDSRERIGTFSLALARRRPILRRLSRVRVAARDRGARQGAAPATLRSRHGTARRLAARRCSSTPKQGLGDALQFARYATLLAEQRCATADPVLSRRLARPALPRVPGVVAAFAPGEPLPHY